MNSTRPWEENWTRESGSSLGGGGQGQTFLVKSRHSKSEVGVLKTQVKRKESDLVSRRRMFQEVTSLRVLSSAGANVPKVLKDNTSRFETIETTLFVVMELIDGPTLRKHIENSGALPLAEAVQVCLSLLSTLDVAFANGIVHRDLKPENMILRSGDPNDVVIIDFGLSFNKEDDHELTKVDEALENNFLSMPERRGPNENKRDPRSDITSVCALLFFCLTGKAPKHLRDSQGRAPHQWDEKLLDSCGADVRVRALLMNLFDRGLQYEVDLRFQTVGELRIRLLELLNPDAPSPIEDIAELVKRHSVQLRRRDRKTQVSELRDACKELPNHLANQTARLGKLIAGAGRFHIGHSSSPISLGIAKPPIGDDIAISHVVMISVPEHSTTYYVTYWVTSEGLEATMFRAIHRAGQKPGLFGSGATKAYEVTPWEVVLRFGSSGLDPSIVVSDIDKSIRRVIPMLTEDICNGWKPEPEAQEILKTAFSSETS